jgi:hypothetical protein
VFHLISLVIRQKTAIIPKKKKFARATDCHRRIFAPNKSSFTSISPVFKMGDVEMANSSADSKPEKLYELPHPSLPYPISK